MGVVVGQVEEADKVDDEDEDNELVEDEDVVDRVDEVEANVEEAELLVVVEDDFDGLEKELDVEVWPVELEEEIADVELVELDMLEELDVLVLDVGLDVDDLGEELLVIVLREVAGVGENVVTLPRTVEER
ncbi:hypothetical protein UCRPC4_g02761 [Phaeomoniella chlamydospora]|uniref:Uncharacterized protein n=1 Tax=Phaeomoniella chlamydospora TaxID=158046 RepID=A0A0G2GKC8_PHACM|nr:hypothetical protein UCRPC4_g02761 [Phaeomoniella chlamydospora]